MGRRGSAFSCGPGGLHCWRWGIYAESGGHNYAALARLWLTPSDRISVIVYCILFGRPDGPAAEAVRLRGAEVREEGTGGGSGGGGVEEGTGTGLSRHAASRVPLPVALQSRPPAWEAAAGQTRHCGMQGAMRPRRSRSATLTDPTNRTPRTGPHQDLVEARLYWT